MGKDYVRSVSLSSTRWGKWIVMRLLILHRYFWPENLSLYPEMLKDIVEYHRQSDDEVAVVTACATAASAQGIRATWANRHGVELFEVPLRYDRGQPLLARIVNAARLCAAFRRAFNRFDPDVVLASSYPPIMSAACVRWLCRRRQKSYVYYCQDISPENLSLIRPQLYPVMKLLESMDRQNVDAAALTITLSKDMKATLLRRTGATGRIVCLNNYIPAATNAVHETVEHEGRGSNPVFIYAGNMGPLQDLATFIRGVDQARRTSDRVWFRVELMGTGMEMETLKALAARKNMDNVAFLPFRPRGEAQRAIANADVGIVSCAPGLSTVAFPSKIMSYLSAGLPVLMIADPGSELEGILSEYRLGLCASAGDPPDIGRKILELTSRVRASLYDRDHIRSVSEEIFGMRRYFRQYDVIMKGVRRAINDRADGN